MVGAWVIGKPRTASLGLRTGRDWLGVWPLLTTHVWSHWIVIIDRCHWGQPLGGFWS